MIKFFLKGRKIENHLSIYTTHFKGKYIQTSNIKIVMRIHLFTVLHYLYLQIRNAEKNFCADSSTDRNSLDVPIIGYPCHKGGGNQVTLLSRISLARALIARLPCLTRTYGPIYETSVVKFLH